MTRDEFRAELVATFDDAFAVSYFDRSYFRDGPSPTLRPWSYTAERKFLGEASMVVKRAGVKLLPPDPEHLKPVDRQQRYANGDLPRQDGAPPAKPRRST